MTIPTVVARSPTQGPESPGNRFSAKNRDHMGRSSPGSAASASAIRRFDHPARTGRNRQSCRRYPHPSSDHKIASWCRHRHVRREAVSTRATMTGSGSNICRMAISTRIRRSCNWPDGSPKVPMKVGSPAIRPPPVTTISMLPIDPAKCDRSIGSILGDNFAPPWRRACKLRLDGAGVAEIRTNSTE